MTQSLEAAVLALDTAHRSMMDAQISYVEARSAVVAAAVALGVKERRVLVMGRTAWYIDPPNGQSSWPDGWTVSMGSPPVNLGGEKT